MGNILKHIHCQKVKICKNTGVYLQCIFASTLNDMYFNKFKKLPDVLDVVLPEFDTQSKCAYSYNNSALSSFDLEKSESSTKSEAKFFIMYNIGFKIPL